MSLPFRPAEAICEGKWDRADPQASGCGLAHEILALPENTFCDQSLYLILDFTVFPPWP